jgi:tetratricopeptide (TPR) repeat protein
MKSHRSPLILLVGFAIAVPAAAQEIPGSYARSDSKGLKAALAKSPDSLGLQLRLAQALTAESQKDPSIKVSEIAKTLKKVLDADPEALVPLRWLVRDAYYDTKNWAEVISYGDRVLKIDPTDIDTATLVVKAMIRTGREADAAESILGWFKSGNMPGSGATQGILSAVMLNQKVKAALEAGFPKLVQANPRLVFVRLAYAAFLSEAGKGEDAWREFHEAEKLGLCDATSGARHPLAQSLLKKWEEPAFPGAVAGNDVNDLVKKVEEVPEHAGLRIRAARRIEMPLTTPKIVEGKNGGEPVLVPPKITDPEEHARIEQAVGLYLKAFELNPACWPPLYRAGELEIERGRYPQAAEVLSKAATSFPDVLPTHLALAEARFRGGDPEGAAQDYLKYARLIEPGKKTRAFFETLSEGKPRLLEPFMDAVEKDMVANPKNAKLRAHLSLLRLIQGDKAAAQKAAVEAERLGLAGLRGWPNAAMMEAFSITGPDSRDSAAK